MNKEDPIGSGHAWLTIKEALTSGTLSLRGSKTATSIAEAKENAEIDGAYLNTLVARLRNGETA